MNSNHSLTKMILSYNQDDVKSVEQIEDLKLQIVNNNSDTKVNKKRKILDEEDYTGRIESIIERDFFPNIPKMRLELEYEDAVKKNDFEKISKLARQKLEQKNKEKVDLIDTPDHFDTSVKIDEPRETDDRSQRNIETEKSVSNQSKNLSLNKFFNKYTSEDNDSFEKLQNKALKKHIEKIEFLNSDSRLHNEKVDESLALPTIEAQQMIKSGKADDFSGNRLITWKHSNKNTVMFDPKGVPLTKQETEQFKSRQVIVHENTRFKSNPFNNALINALPNVSSPLKLGKIGVDGKEFDSKSTPNVNGFSFVPSTPCIKPESLPNNSPLMTWGVIETTPINLKGDTTPLLHSNSCHFKIPEIPEKEMIGQELANRILSKNRPSHQVNRLESSFVKGNQKKSSLERLNSMSPAARLFATKKLGVHQHMDSSLQASYSPLMTSARTPTPRRIITPSPTTLSVPTPKSSSKTNNSKNFHQIDKRPKASEFF